MEKYCPSCKETKSYLDFYNKASSDDGLDSRCKICSNVTTLKSKAKRKAIDNGTHVEPEPIIEYTCRECSQTKPLSEYTINNRSKHGYDYECKTCRNILAKKRRRTPDGRKRDWMTRCKVTAKKKGVPFNMEPDDIILNEICPILGITIDYYSDGKSDFSPSLDRLIPSKGYIKGNVAVVSERANRLKNDASIEEVRLLLKYLTKMLT